MTRENLSEHGVPLELDIIVRIGLYWAPELYKMTRSSCSRLILEKMKVKVKNKMPLAYLSNGLKMKI